MLRARVSKILAILAPCDSLVKMLTGALLYVNDINYSRWHLQSGDLKQAVHNLKIICDL